MLCALVDRGSFSRSPPPGHPPTHLYVLDTACKLSATPTQALRMNDIEAYTKLVEDTKSERLKWVECLVCVCVVKSQPSPACVPYVFVR